MPRGSRHLDTEELGGLGETAFEQVCIRNNLSGNKAKRDRTGFDYVVEWLEKAEPAKKIRDKLPPSLSCSVQVKAKWDGNDYVDVSLASVERLARDSKPAFFYIFTFADDTQLISSHVIHVMGDFLAKIQLRSREAYKNKTNDKKARFGFSVKEFGIPMTGDLNEFRRYVEDCVGSSMHEYGNRKSVERDTVGYENGGVELRGNFKVPNLDALKNAFLGIGHVEIDISEAIDTRFGISVPIPDFPLGAGRAIFPQSNGEKCVIYARQDIAGDPVRFKGKIFRLPKALSPPGQLESIVLTDLFRLTLHSNGQVPDADLRLKLSTDGELISTAQHRAEDWQSFYQFMAMFSSESLRIEIAFKGNKKLLGVTMTPDTPGENVRDWKRLARISEILVRVLRKAAAPNTKLNILDVSDRLQDLEVLLALIDRSPHLNPMVFETTPVAGIEDGYRTDLLFFGHITLGKHTLFYCVSVLIEAKNSDGKIDWKSVEYRFEGVQRLPSSSTPTLNRAASEYVDQMRKNLKVENYYIAKAKPAVADE